MGKYDSLFTPFRIGKCEIRNRFIIPAMEGTNIVDNLFGPRCEAEKVRDYYTERADNDVGLFIPGMIPVYSMMMGKWAHRSPAVFRKAEPLIDEIHRRGAKIFFQIGSGFAGRNYTLPAQMIDLPSKPFMKKLTNPFLHLNDMMVAPDDGLPLVWAPQYTTRALTVKEIKRYVGAYAECARLSREAGADGVEVHAVHEGYLMDQFTLRYTNHRSDEYGGSFENRYRFPVEVVKAIKEKCGSDFPVSLRYSVTSKVIDFRTGAVPGEEFREIGRDMEESEKAAKYLEEAGYDALDCDNGTYDSWYWAHPPVYMPLNCNLKEAEHISKFVDIPVICAGRMQPGEAERSVREGLISAVAIGRQLIADGEYITKLKEGREKEIRPCISCHNACLPVAYYRNSGAVMSREDAAVKGHCAINPVSFAERKYVFEKTSAIRKVAVIGGGIAGMQTSILLRRKGYQVDLYEKSSVLGGVFIAAASPSFKEKDRELIEWYRRETLSSGVNVHLNTEITDIASVSADEYVIATGAKARKLSLPGFEKGIEAVEYLLGRREVGERVAVIGGGLTGCEIAYDLALKGRKPVIVEMTDDLVKAPGICAANSNCLRDLLRFHKVEVHLNSSLLLIGDGFVEVKTEEGKKKRIDCDSVILSVGYVPSPLNADGGEHIHIIGDASKVGNLKTAVWGAYDLCLTI
jgi:2-enoate reductase